MRRPALPIAELAVMLSLFACSQAMQKSVPITPATEVTEIMAKADAALARKDYAEAFRWNLRGAELGDARAQNNLGAFYTDGLGVVVPNSREAMKWYRMAAEGGNVQAKKNIGDLYIAATVPPICRDPVSGTVSVGCFWVDAPNDPNFVEAMKWYRAAADEGNTGAMANIGWMFALGKGAIENCALARQWFAKAAAAGNKTASENLRVDCRLVRLTR
jgi:TPR repeat protein